LLEVCKRFDSLLRVNIHANGAAKNLIYFVWSTLPFAGLKYRNRLCGVLYWVSLFSKTTQTVTDWAFELTFCILNAARSLSSCSELKEGDWTFL
jgi:hypothetical protein